MKKEKDPSKLDIWSTYQFNGKVVDIIKKLQEIANRHPKATIQSFEDYSGCYYESDSPETKFVIRSK